MYFARDASYSVSPTYASPDDQGVQRLFACRILVGEVCRGRQNQITPDVRLTSTGVLYDSTTDSTVNPTMWVTYNDAQALPEYIVEVSES